MQEAWPEDLAAELKALWASGKSAAVIACELGITRNAVIGKVHRLGLDGRRTIAVMPIGESGWKLQQRHARKRERARARFKVVAMVKPDPPPLVFEQPSNAPVQIIHLERHHCRWVIGEPAELMFCGATRQPSYSYCPFHVKQAYSRG